VGSPQGFLNFPTPFYEVCVYNNTTLDKNNKSFVMAVSASEGDSEYESAGETVEQVSRIILSAESRLKNRLEETYLVISCDIIYLFIPIDL